MAPIMTQQMARIVKQLYELGRTIVLVEQNARLTLLLGKHAHVMETGRISMSGLVAALKDDKRLRET